ncbi:lipoprotein [Mycoplasma cottewii]|uniref:Lipoprotein n=1 Tax=Mycoplasma cottewii TaxID=51364 RepID=A0ABY5TYD3_9MOLU|nr:lipoprotein [Mycoplasma cottewii]UWD35041.1 lipoprotein [Mycoplasma cottewii]
MKKLLTILGSVAMVATTGAVAVACKTEAKPDKPVVQKQKLTDLVTVKTGIELAPADKGDVKKVVDAVNAKNPNAKLDHEQLAVEAIQGAENKLKLSAKQDSAKYEGSVEIEFTAPTPDPVVKQKLTDLVTVKTGIELAPADKGDVKKLLMLLMQKPKCKTWSWTISGWSYSRSWK